MFIRDLEYCQLEVSDNQFALVNGGGEETTAPAPVSYPFALTTFTVDAVALGTKLAIADVKIGGAAITTRTSALSALKISGTLLSASGK